MTHRHCPTVAYVGAMANHTGHISIHQLYLNPLDRQTEL